MCFFDVGARVNANNCSKIEKKILSVFALLILFHVTLKRISIQIWITINFFLCSLPSKFQDQKVKEKGKKVSNRKEMCFSDRMQIAKRKMSFVAGSNHFPLFFLQASSACHSASKSIYLEKKKSLNLWKSDFHFLCIVAKKSKSLLGITM